MSTKESQADAPSPLTERSADPLGSTRAAALGQLAASHAAGDLDPSVGRSSEKEVDSMQKAGVRLVSGGRVALRVVRRVGRAEREQHRRSVWRREVDSVSNPVVRGIMAEALETQMGRPGPN